MMLRTIKCTKYRDQVADIVNCKRISRKIDEDNTKILSFCIWSSFGAKSIDLIQFKEFDIDTVYSIPFSFRSLQSHLVPDNANK